MRTQRKATTTAKDRKEAKERNLRLSPAGKWRSFPKVPHLLQYKPTAMHYARVRVYGKLVRRKLKTNVYSKALLRVSDFLTSKPLKGFGFPSSLITPLKRGVNERAANTAFPIGPPRSKSEMRP